jgi:hypothetical protein
MQRKDGVQPDTIVSPRQGGDTGGDKRNRGAINRLRRLNGRMGAGGVTRQTTARMRADASRGPGGPWLATSIDGPDRMRGGEIRRPIQGALP